MREEKEATRFEIKKIEKRGKKRASACILAWKSTRYASGSRART